MSLDALRWVNQVARTGRVHGATLHLLRVLAFYANPDDGLAFPGDVRIAGDLGVSVDNVRRARIALAGAELLPIIPAVGRQPITYVFPAVTTEAAEVVHTPRETAGCVDTATPREIARNPPRNRAQPPAKSRAVTERELIEKTARAPDPELDGHEAHRPGDCEECDRGRARVVALCGDLSVWTPASDPRIGRWS